MATHFLPGPRTQLPAPGEDPILDTAFTDRLLAAPAYLSATEVRTVTRDLQTVLALARSLPERLFDGSVAAMARGVGFEDRDAALIASAAAAGPLLPYARADLYHDGEHFRLLELNVTTALGGLEVARVNRALLRQEPLRAHVEARGLQFQDPVAALARTLVATCRSARDTPDPLFAVVDLAKNIPAGGGTLQGLTTLLEAEGVLGRACHPAELTYRGGHPYIDGRRVDGILRQFMLGDFSYPDLGDELTPVVRAVAAREVEMCSGLDAELYGSKGTLAVLSDNQHRQHFSVDELDCVDRFLPWTRYMRQHSTDPGGSGVNLVAYARARQDELVLKPTNLHGGQGVLLGWQTDPAEWLAHVERAVGGPYILQQRVRPSVEEYPADGPARNLVLNWGVFVAGETLAGPGGYAGCLIRAQEATDEGVISVGHGARLGCVFHESLT
ncbi:hypothetical protein AB0H83_14130 [Dactylosporangium sp. NPDC050688]|uniref:hypothetical protein n=1 Tax=Dactylosporangium sp. NPDC050688 TaxID=3157217 RepID=UPI0033EA932C